MASYLTKEQSLTIWAHAQGLTFEQFQAAMRRAKAKLATSGEWSWESGPAVSHDWFEMERIVQNGLAHPWMDVAGEMGDKEIQIECSTPGMEWTYKYEKDSQGDYSLIWTWERAAERQESRPDHLPAGIKAACLAELGLSTSSKGSALYEMWIVDWHRLAMASL